MTKTTPKPPKKSLYPQKLFVEIYNDDSLHDNVLSFTAEEAMESEDGDELTLAVYKFEKMIIVRREEKIVVEDA